MDSLKSSDQIELPPGFRFHPTDEELITHYLSPRVMNNVFCAIAIGEVDLNKCEPWELPGRAKMGEKEWYFFCVRDRKYPTGLRTNRATEAGYWKATGKDKEIYREKTLIGMKKTLVFYRGRAPKGQKSCWVMHEYRLQGTDSVHNLQKHSQDEWVVCRVFEKNSGSKKANISGFELNSSSVLPPLMDSSSSMEDMKLNPSEVLSVSNSFYPEFSQLPNSYFFKLLLENQLLDMKQICTAELSPEAGLSTDISSVLSNHEIGQDDPSSQPVHLDYLWNY